MGFHDFAHTCEVTTALARLMDGNLARRPKLRLHMEDYNLGIAAALLHDSGYLKQADDRSPGTGAKFTAIHVPRSSQLAGRFLLEFNLQQSEIEIVQRTILWTGVGIDFDALQHENEAERFLGGALGTADLMGQMAAPAYPARLGELFKEFNEAAEYPYGCTPVCYRNVEELLRKTRGFFDGYVMPVLEDAYRGVFHDYTYHFPDRTNQYLLRIEEEFGKDRPPRSEPRPRSERIGSGFTGAAMARCSSRCSARPRAIPNWPRPSSKGGSGHAGRRSPSCSARPWSWGN